MCRNNEIKFEVFCHEVYIIFVAGCFAQMSWTELSLTYAKLYNFS